MKNRITSLQWRRLVLCLMALAMITVSASAVVIWPLEETQAIVESEINSAIEGGSQIVAIERGTGIKVETQFMTFFYPTKYEQDLIIDLEETQDTSIVTVKAKLGENELDLYTFTLSTGEISGHQFGTLKTDEQTEVGVYLSMFEQFPENWNDEDYAYICGLQESVNELLMQLYDNEGFIG